MSKPKPPPPGFVFVENVYVIRENYEALFIETDDRRRLWVKKGLIGRDSEVYREGQEGRLLLKSKYAKSLGLFQPSNQPLPQQGDTYGSESRPTQPGP